METVQRFFASIGIALTRGEIPLEVGLAMALTVRTNPVLAIATTLIAATLANTLPSIVHVFDKLFATNAVTIGTDSVEVVRRTERVGRALVWNAQLIPVEVWPIVGFTFALKVNAHPIGIFTVEPFSRVTKF